MQSLDFEQFFQSVFLIAFGSELKLESFQTIAGGNINSSVKLETNMGNYFLKWNEHGHDDMFEREESGLMMLSASKAVKIPYTIARGKVNHRSFLLMEYLEAYPASGSYWRELGTSLACLHRVSNHHYGLSYNNYIGSLVQKNEARKDWITFFIENRLEVQLGLAYYNGLVSKEFMQKFRCIYSVLPGEFPNETPSLLHGDLWSGNVVASRNGPYLIDPAVYFGHREVDLAFTLLFGYFERGFYEAYHEAFPLEPGFESRADLYNLYPLLVHTNLFGTSYLAGIERTLRKYL